MGLAMWDGGMSVHAADLENQADKILSGNSPERTIELRFKLIDLLVPDHMTICKQSLSPYRLFANIRVPSPFGPVGDPTTIPSLPRNFRLSA
jgi:hypothetical protein